MIVRDPRSVLDRFLVHGAFQILSTPSRLYFDDHLSCSILILPWFSSSRTVSASYIWFLRSKWPFLFSYANSSNAKGDFNGRTCFSPNLRYYLNIRKFRHGRDLFATLIGFGFVILLPYSISIGSSVGQRFARSQFWSQISQLHSYCSRSSYRL
jgi:hypothetical protein